MKLATVNPVFGLMLHPEAMPAQFDVRAVPKLKFPTVLSGLILFFRRRITLTPIFRLLRPSV